MTHNKTTSFSLIKDYDSTEAFLKESFSGQVIKKQRFSKAFLFKPLSREDQLDLDLDFFNRGIVNPIYHGPDVDILHEDQNFIVFNKSYGIHGHPLNYSENQTILNYLRSSGRGKFLYGYEKSYEKGLLYRLDEVTSGVLIYVKNPSLHRELRGSFKEVAKKKTYLALVRGDFSKTGHHSHFFSAKGNKGSTQKALALGDGELGEAYYKKLIFKPDENISLVKIELVTGLRHQIRSQLSALGFPILGDQHYGGEEAQRVFLHAYHYEIIVRGQNFSFIAKEASLFERLIQLDHDSIL